MKALNNHLVDFGFQVAFESSQESTYSEPTSVLRIIVATSEIMTPIPTFHFKVDSEFSLNSRGSVTIETLDGVSVDASAAKTVDYLGYTDGYQVIFANESQVLPGATVEVKTSSDKALFDPIISNGTVF